MPRCTDLTSLPANGGFYFQAFDGTIALPVAGYDYNSDWTPLLAGLSPAGMAASLTAPDPYGPNSGIRLPPRVSDGAIVWRDGSVEALGAVRSTGARGTLAVPSVAKQFRFNYSLLPWSPENLPTSDAGRIRQRSFFDRMYGDCRHGEPLCQTCQYTHIPRSLALSTRCERPSCG